jgi:O-antigen/teichoic acid export membrane protein
VIVLKGSLLVAVWGQVGWKIVYVLGVLILGFRSVGFADPRLGLPWSNLSFSLPLVPRYHAATILSFADRVFIAAHLGPNRWRDICAHRDGAVSSCQPRLGSGPSTSGAVAAL